MKNGKFQSWRVTARVDKRWLATVTGQEVKEGTSVTSDVHMQYRNDRTHAAHLFLMSAHAVADRPEEKVAILGLLARFLPLAPGTLYDQQPLPNLDDYDADKEIPF
jgi:hypothetical protein